jgi:hypothetical protein
MRSPFPAAFVAFDTFLFNQHDRDVDAAFDVIVRLGNRADAQLSDTPPVTRTEARCLDSARVIAALVDAGHRDWCHSTMWRDVVGYHLHYSTFPDVATAIGCLADPVSWDAACTVYGSTSHELLLDVCLTEELASVASRVGTAMRLASITYPALSVAVPEHGPLFRNPHHILTDPWTSAVRVLEVLGAEVWNLKPAFVRGAEPTTARHLCADALHREMTESLLVRVNSFSHAPGQKQQPLDGAGHMAPAGGLSTIGDAVTVAAAAVAAVPGNMASSAGSRTVSSVPAGSGSVLEGDSNV